MHFLCVHKRWGEKTLSNQTLKNSEFQKKKRSFEAKGLSVNHRTLNWSKCWLRKHSPFLRNTRLGKLNLSRKLENCVTFLQCKRLFFPAMLLQFSGIERFGCKACLHVYGPEQVNLPLLIKQKQFETCFFWSILVPPVHFRGFLSEPASRNAKLNASNP